MRNFIEKLKERGRKDQKSGFAAWKEKILTKSSEKSSKSGETDKKSNKSKNSKNEGGIAMSFWDQVEVFVNESVKFSKQAYGRAREFGSLTKLEMEIKTLQSKAHKAFAALGGLVYEKISDKDMTTIDASDQEIAEFISEIQKIEKDIKEKEEEAKKLRSAEKAEQEADNNQ